MTESNGMEAEKLAICVEAFGWTLFCRRCRRIRRAGSGNLLLLKTDFQVEVLSLKSVSWCSQLHCQRCIRYQTRFRKSQCG